MYSFSKHQRLEQTTSIYSPHVLILEGIFALYDPRVLQLMDMKVRFGGALPSTYRVSLRTTTREI